MLAGLEGREKFDGTLGDKGEMRLATPEENQTFAEQALKDSRAWTIGGKIFINADAISGKSADEVVEQAIQLGMFHEPIAHIGLKAHLESKGKGKFNEFLDDFFVTNKRDIEKWVTKYASAYLDEDQNIKDIPQSKQRELAEEYLANLFVEFGVRDPNILAKIADSITRGGFSLIGKRRVTTVQAREMLAEIQQEYIGGERNIITGDFFDRSHWLKPAKRAGGKEAEEPQWVPPKIVGTAVDTGAPIPQLALPAKTEGPLTPTVAETVARERSEGTILGKLKKKIKSKKKDTEETQGEASEASEASEVRHAKRVSTPQKRKLWQKTHPASTTPEITKRDKELTGLANKLEKGQITNEEYRTRYEEKFPIRRFAKVPVLASKTEVAGSIDQGQYDNGKLIGEDSDLKDGMEVLVRTDVKTVEKYGKPVIAVVSPEAKGSHYGGAIHIDSYKDGKPVKTVVRNLKEVLGIAAGGAKFPMAYFKGTYRATSPTKVKSLAQKALKSPEWIQVGMEPKRQSSFYARETKTINGKEIKEGTPINTAEEVYQVGMFAIVKNPTTKVAPTFTSREGVEVRHSKAPKDQSVVYDTFYKENKGIFWRGAGDGDYSNLGNGMGKLGTGVYLSQDESFAGSFARRTEGGRIYEYEVRPDLRIADAEEGKELIKIKKFMGLGLDDWREGPQYANYITEQLKKLGFDGVMSGNLGNGLLIFDAADVRQNRTSYGKAGEGKVHKLLTTKFAPRKKEGTEVRFSKEYHGAPATFDKFKTSKIGRVNVYGWGLYFTSDKGLAEVYASQVPEGWAKKDAKKRVYEVSLAPKEVDYMDWNLPLRKQSKIVKKGVNKILKTLSPESPLKRWFRLNMGEMTGKDFYQWVTYTFMAKKVKDMKGAGHGKVNEKKASLYLLSKGIRGNKIITTRSKGRPDVVYKVIFSEGDIKIDARHSKRLATGKKLDAEWKLKIKNAVIPDTEEVRFSKAYHGSGAKFDTFSTDFVGTGEQNQAYGWGLYFSAKKEVAEWYHKALSQRRDNEVLPEKDAKDYYKKGNNLEVLFPSLFARKKGTIKPYEVIGDPVYKEEATVRQTYMRVPLRGIFSKERHSRVKEESYYDLKVPAHFTVKVKDLEGNENILTSLGVQYWDGFHKDQINPKTKEFIRDEKIKDTTRPRYKEVTQSRFGEMATTELFIDVRPPENAEFKRVTDRELLNPKGSLLEVELAPKDHEYLMYDKPLKDQSKTVKDAILKTLDSKPVRDYIKEDTSNPLNNSKFRKNFESYISKGEPLSENRPFGGAGPMINDQADQLKGHDFYYLAERGLGSDKKASQYLHSLGVKGNKYYTGETRNKKEKDYNYVIFHDDDVAIEARFAKKVDQPTAAELEAEFLKKGGKVKPDTEEPTVGININDSKQNFTAEILSGNKTIETRDSNSLKSFIGQEVGLIRTGKGKAEVVGYATVGEPVVYNNRAEFKKDQSKHLVKTGSDYDIRTGKTKYGYPLTNVRKVSPFPVTSKGIVSRKIDSPKKKTGQASDKVSVGNKKFASGVYTRASISPKQFVNPKGEVRTSKILMRSAATHAMGSSSWNPFAAWTEKTQPYADKILQHITAQGTLPDRLKYHALRRRIKGIIKNAEDAGKELYDILKDTKQADVIFNYFTTKGANPRLITDRTERAAAVAAKEKIDSIGRELVDKKLMREKTRQEHEGAYLPQVYLKYLLGQDNFRRAVTRGGVAIDMKYLIARKDIPEGVKKLIYGEIKDPAYLASKATSVPVKDMAILDWLGHIAANPNWVVPKSMVSFDTLGTMKDIIKDHKLSKELLDTLDIKDTKAVKVSSYWLENESARINDMKEDMELTAEEKKIVVGLTKAMKKSAKEITGQNYDTKEYRTVPKTPKYGMLAGIAVRKEIYDDIFGGMTMTTGDLSTAEMILGNGSPVGDYNRLWKWAKVPANPPSWVRNFGSNLILMNMGGVSIGSMPGLMISSLADMRKAGKHKGQLHKLAKDLGLTAGTFSNVELGRIEKEFKHLEAKIKGKTSTPWAALGAMKGAFSKFQDATTNLYGGIDSLGKMMMLKSQLDKQGIEIKDLAKYKGDEKLALDDIAANAEKWLFDYSNVLPSVRFLRQAPFGAPFISFTSFVAPLMLETAITKPWKFAPYYALGWAMKEWFKNNHDLDDEDLEGLKVGLSEYLREKATESFFPTGVIPLPFLDANKRVQFLDVSYIYPWGMFSEIAGELTEGNIGGALKTVGLMGSPLFNIASAVSTGIDPFSRRQIIDPNGTPTEQAMDIWWYAFNLTMPPMLHGAGPGNEGFGALTRLHEAWTGELTKEGEARFTMGQAFGRMAGFNVTPLAVPEGRTKHLRWDYSQIQKFFRQAKRDIKNMYMMQKPKSEIAQVKKEYMEKLADKVHEFQEKVRISKPPKSLMKERRSFQREKEHAALKYASVG